MSLTITTVFFLKVLPAIHALTGCNSTSVFSGIGKSSVYKTISEKGVDSFAELVFICSDDEKNFNCWSSQVHC